MPEDNKVRLRKRDDKEAGVKVESARFQVGLAVLRMEHMLKQVHETAKEAKEELSAGRSG